MAEFKGKNGHWVTTESGAHIFIESGGSFDEAVEKAFGKENKGKYKKAERQKGDTIKTNSGRELEIGNIGKDDNGNPSYWLTDKKTGEKIGWKGEKSLEKLINDNFDDDDEDINKGKEEIDKYIGKFTTQELFQLINYDDFFESYDENEKDALRKYAKEKSEGTKVFGYDSFDDDNDFENWDDDFSEFEQAANNITTDKNKKGMYYSAFKDAYEKFGHKPTRENVENQLRDAYYTEMDNYQEGNGYTDEEMDEFGADKFYAEYGYEQEFIDNGLKAFDKMKKGN